MSKAIGMVEYQTIPSGMQAADLMLKTADVEVLQAQTVCPGKYIVLVSGDLSAVKASVDAAKVQLGGHLDDSFVLGNPHDSIFSAIYGVSPVEEVKALGVLETYSVASIIVAADAAAKTSEVSLIELRIARGMSGKSYMLLTGDVAAVQAAIERAQTVVGDEGMYMDSVVIPNPDKRMWSSIM